MSRYRNSLLRGRPSAYHGFAVLFGKDPPQYGRHIGISSPFHQALEHVQGALKAEGFGILSDIDVQEAMKEKLGKDMPA